MGKNKREIEPGQSNVITTWLNKKPRSEGETQIDKINNNNNEKEKTGQEKPVGIENLCDNPAEVEVLDTPESLQVQVQQPAEVPVPPQPKRQGTKYYPQKFKASWTQIPAYCPWLQKSTKKTLKGDDLAYCK